MHRAGLYVIIDCVEASNVTEMAMKTTEFYLVAPNGDRQRLAIQFDESSDTLDHNERLFRESARKVGMKIERIDRE